MEETKFRIRYPLKEIIVGLVLLLAQPILLFLLPNHIIVIVWVVIAELFFCYHLAVQLLINILKKSYFIFNEEGLEIIGLFNRTRKYFWNNYQGYRVVDNLLIIQFGKNKVKIISDNLVNGSIKDIISIIEENMVFIARIKIKHILETKTDQDAIREIYFLLFPSLLFPSRNEELFEYGKNIVYIGILDEIVSNRGFSMYFEEYGFYAMETIKALESVGSEISLDLLKQAIDRFPNGTIPEDMDERHALIYKFREEKPDLWKDLDNKFRKGEENLSDLLIKYIKEFKTIA